MNEADVTPLKRKRNTPLKLKDFVQDSKPIAEMQQNSSNCSFDCEECGKTYKLQNSLLEHKKKCRKKATELSNKSSDSVENKKKYACKHCDHEAKNKAELCKHIGQSHKFICDICHKMLASESSLKKHVKYSHLNKEEYKCDKCDYTAHYPSTLKRHMVVKHTDSTLFQCPICKTVVKQMHVFKVHMRIHLDEKPFQCSICNKKFHCSSHLSSHRKVHEKPSFSCDECNSSFKTRSHLKRHKVIHTKEKPYSCDLCSYSCNFKNNVIKHMRTVHHVFENDTKKYKIPDTDPTDSSPSLTRGNNIAVKLAEEYAKRNDTVMTVDLLKENEIENRKKRLEEIELTKQNLISKKEGRDRRKVEKSIPNGRSALVINNGSGIVALDELSGAVIPITKDDSVSGSVGSTTGQGEESAVDVSAIVEETGETQIVTLDDGSNLQFQVIYLCE